MCGQSPVLLAQLPQPLFEPDKQFHFGPCYGLTGSRKRKRFEIAAAVDGETLNIYDVGKFYCVWKSPLIPERYKRGDFYRPMLFLRRPPLRARRVQSADDIHRARRPHDTQFVQFSNWIAKLNVS